MGIGRVDVVCTYYGYSAEFQAICLLKHASVFALQPVACSALGSR